ncbi:ABC transporter, partial [Oscillibacter valericigenes]|nr:ABC transporter [Oscillibacter valericigenes]
MIECRDVSFSYPASGPVDGECLTEGALKHITCTIEDGSFVLLCGASGCGKT